MSTNFDSDKVLTGAWAYVFTIDDPSATSPTTALVGYKHDEATLAQEFQEAEFNFAENKNTVRKRLHAAKDIEFIVAVVQDYENLSTLGLVDTSTTPATLNDTVTRNLRWEVYEDKPGDLATATPELRFDLMDCDIAWTEQALPQDGSSVTLSAYINGGVQLPDVA